MQLFYHQVYYYVSLYADLSAPLCFDTCKATWHVKVSIGEILLINRLERECQT